MMKIRSTLGLVLLLILMASGCGSAAVSLPAQPPSAASLGSAEPTATEAPSGIPGSIPTAARIPGRIAYDTGDGAIWTMNGDGTDQRRLTQLGGSATTGGSD